MTLEDLLECSTEKLESFTDRQLEEWFKPLFPVTRPEQALHKAEAKQTANAQKLTLANDPRVLAAAKQAKEYGIDLNALLKGL